MANELKPIRVVIDNFQSIDHLEFDIEGFTAITGRTNIGKSAIIRAISSAILNNPVVGMVRKGATHATVNMSCDGWGFKWEKGERGINRYMFPDGKVLDKVGQTQLEEVKEFGFRSVKVGKDEIHPWLASQFFPIFLLEKTGSQITDFISEVSRLNVLQDAVVLAARGKMRSSSDAKGKSDDAAGVRTKQKALGDVGVVVGLHGDLEKQLRSIQEYEARLEAAVRLQTILRTSAEKIESIRGVENVHIPDGPDAAEVGRYAVAVRLDTSLRGHAARVIPLRKVTSIVVPQVPAELETLRRMESFGWITGESDRIRRFEAAAAAQIPCDLPSLDDLKNAERIHDRIVRLQAAQLSDTPPVPDIPDVSELQRIGRLRALNATMMAEAAELRSLKARSQDLASAIDDVERDLAQIPTCPTCARPVSQPMHQHEAA